MDSLPRPTRRPQVSIRAPETLLGMALFVLPRAAGQIRVDQLQDLAGSQEIHSVPLPCSPTPAGLHGLTVTAKQCGPHNSEHEDTGVILSRGSITRLQYLLPTLQVVRHRTRMQGSLPVAG